MNWRVSAFVALYGELRLGWSRAVADAHMRTFWELDEVWTNFAATCRANMNATRGVDDWQAKRAADD